ncbi:uncharacterized protein LOC134747621 isoform X2 [Cydia strobilella]|uniref:uncharacterized protein LOC134747621 isoform X2 n=1 Tax=Cydia strobilella TaxID=1100964 RepID=UPI00300528BF
MAQCRSNTKLKDSLRLRSGTSSVKDDSGCDPSPEEPFADSTLPESDGEEHKSRPTSTITLRSKSRADSQSVPDVGSTGSSPTTHSNMKTKQAKDELDKSIDEETTIEPKTRQAKKKASDISEENKASQDEPKTSKESKKNLKPKAVVKKRPLGIRKALRSKKVITTAKSKLKNVIKQTATRGRKPVVKTEPEDPQDKETVPLIPVAEIKKEPVDDTTPISRSSSPKTAGRKQRLTSDKIMLKSVLAESPTSLLGSRTSPYSMRSERSNSPSLVENKIVRRGKPRNVKSKLLNEVVMKEQNKRRRLLSDSKTSDTTDASEDCKKLKRGRSCSREGSEISKCSDITESDVSLSETLTDADGKELNKKLEKPKTELDLDFENNVQISITEKVPSLIDPKLTDPVTEPSSNTNEKSKKNTSLKRSTSLDSDNNNSNRLKLENLNSSEDKKGKTDKDTLLDARSSILSSMSKTFNTKEVAKNLRKARRGRKVAAAARPRVGFQSASRRASAGQADDTDKTETLETLSKEIDDLINNLDQNIDRDHEMASETADEVQTKSVSKFYGLSKPLGDNNSIITPETPVKDKETPSVTTDSTPSKTDDSENIRLHYEEDSLEKAVDANKPEITYKVSSVASIDKLMDRLKVFEEFDKKRQRQESEVRSTDSKTVMVTNDVVLINKSGADIKQLKDVHTVRSPERPIEKENVLSCFENNSAISIVKRDQVRKSIDIDLPNSVTLIKRNSFSSRKESTSSNHSKESDAISIFEKSLGKDVTLTEIRKSVDRSAPATQVDLHQFATLHPNNPTTSLKGVVLDTSQISITPRVMDSSIRRSRESLSRKTSESVIEPEEKMAVLEKIKSPPPQIKSPPPTPIAVAPTPIAVAPTPIVVAPTPIAVAPTPITVAPTPIAVAPKPITVTPTPIALAPSPIAVAPTPIAVAPTAITVASTPIVVAPTPVAVKSPEEKPMETEALAPPLENVKIVPEDISLATEIPKVVSVIPEKPADITTTEQAEAAQPEPVKPEPMVEDILNVEKVEEKMKIPEESKEEKMEVPEEAKDTGTKTETPVETKPSESKLSESADLAKPGKSPGKTSKSARNSTESQPGPSTMLHETPESQKRKENVLRTLGLLTHKAAKEAKIEKLKEKQRIANMNVMKKSKQGSGDYTGTLKTVIKLNRGGADRDKKKYRSSLKMTFQKSKNRAGKPAPEPGDAAAEDDAYYTIERREAFAGAASEVEAEAAPEPEPKETLNLVIPEKASSFSIHPGRLCQDQCFYCGGKFGLFDTPCHIAQMKSTERQKKVLDNEERLTIDSCLCDACYRHVDRRANCPSYRKRAPKPPGQPPQPQQAEKPLSPSESESEPAPGARCHAAGCGAAAARSIRRKWLIKMRTPVSKLLKLQSDYPGLHTLGLCTVHYALLAPLLACALCRRRLTKHQHVHILQQGHTEVNPLLAAAGIPVELADKPVLCKLCRYYTTLLRRPGDNPAHERQYRRRLLQVYNIEVPPESENEGEDTRLQLDDSARRKKARSKNKRKSSDPDRPDSDSRTPERMDSPEKDKNQPKTQPDEEDIESLISSNKILVPNAKGAEPMQSDGSDPDGFDMDPVLDKQTELQILLQKQNNPAQFMHNQANLTQKQRNILKVHHLSGIQKPGLQQRINDKNARRLHKLGQMIVKQDKKNDDLEIFDPEKSRDVSMKNLSINEECTIESIPNKKPADINTLKNKWQQSESFTQVKKNLSELSKKLTVEKDPKQKSEVKYSNPVKRLETNPSISVRELFPGEEEMNLQCNIEFGNVKGVTPEGWEKCSTTIQYDVETKKLWNDLQRPYGNQSSFLRHLILLEKYFRSGDLVLAHNASANAANYSDSVQSRLRAYDNVVNDAPRRSEPSISLIEFRKKPAVNGKSLLKTNQSMEDKDPKKFMPPPPALPKPKPKEKKSKPLPPELIAINTPNAQGRKAIQNVLHNIQQLVKGVSASDPTEVAASPVPVPVSMSVPVTMSVPVSMPVPVAATTPDKKKEDKPHTPKKQKTTSKPWRPTLMPITPENVARAAREPIQTAVDGRRLPSLVKVMSSGKQYHITLQDYNKMCVMRREKLQQLGHDEKPKKPETETVVTEVQTSAMLGNGGTVVQNITESEKLDLTHGSNAATILKNVGLKNITIAPITPKTATVTSQTFPAPVVTSPSLLVTSTPLKLPQLGPAVSITSETVLPSLPIIASSPMIMPKIPKSLTVIPQSLSVSAHAHAHMPGVMMSAPTPDTRP